MTHQPTEVAPVPAKNPYPVLWIVIDTLRADTLYGDQLDFPLTPQFRELKDEFISSKMQKRRQDGPFRRSQRL